RMSEDHKNEGGFKIVDRRSFDASGNPRAADEKAEAVRRQEPPPAAAKQPRPEPPPRETTQPSESAEPAESDDAQAYHVGEAADALGPLDFPQFILSVAQLAFTFLGDLPNAQTGRRERNLGAAKQQIELLVL